MSAGKENQIDMPEEMLSFYNQLALLQDDLHARVNLPEISVNENEIQQHRAQQKSWLQILSFPEITAGFQQHLLEIAEFTKKGRPLIKEQIEEIMNAISDVDPAELLEKTLWLDTVYFEDLAGQKNISAGILVFLLQNALRPYLRAWGQSLEKQQEAELWLKPYCPICGQKSSISRLRPGDGSRMLYCSHCNTEWKYRMLYCPHCDNDDPASLNIITIEGNEIDQIYTCEKCKGYLKTINERNVQGSSNMLVESARTFFLDLLAEREGYSNPAAERHQLN